MTNTADAGTAARGATLALVERAMAIRLDGVPAHVRSLGVQCLVDWFAVTLAGARDPIVDRLVAEAIEEGGRPCAGLVGRAERCTPGQAALINGTASHALDYDDVNLNINGHPSAVLVPAVLAAGQRRGSRGDALLAAFLAGYEFACRAGRLVAPGHYLRGYHATASVGVLGAAVACARLFDLDTERTAHAVGIAATQAAGLKGLFGTECKPFHAGMAAQNGLRAASLAARGMQARTDALECRQGFAAVTSPDLDPDAALGEPGRWFIEENLFKYHAACYGTHSAIESARRLVREHGVRPGEIDTVVVRVERGSDAVCNIPEPRTGLEAKFSLRLTTAMALAGRDTADLAAYCEATAADPALVGLRDRTRVELVDGWPLMQAEVELTLRDGRRLADRCDTGEPARDVDDQGRRVAAKFDRLASGVLGAAGAAALATALGAIETVPVDRVIELARGTA